MKLSELKTHLSKQLEALRLLTFQNPGQMPMLPAADILNIFLILVNEIEVLKNENIVEQIPPVDPA